MLWVPDEVVALLEVAKPVPPLELVLVFWGYSGVENFHSESVSAVVARVKFVSVVEMCFYERCGKSDSSHFLLHHHTKKRKCRWGVLNNRNYVNLLWLFLGKKMPLGYIGVY